MALMGARLLALAILSAVGAGCAYSPCLGDGVIEGDVYLEDGIATTGGFMINGEQGTTESSAIEGCTGVAGSVRVQGDVSTVHVLDSLEWIGGNVWFDGVTGLDVIDGMNALESIGGFLWFNDSPAAGDWSPIHEISGFQSLREIGGELWMFAVVGDVTGMGAVESIGGDVHLQGAPRSFAGQWEVTRLSMLWVRSGELTNLRVFGNVSDVVGDLHLDSPDDMLTTGLGALESVGGEFRVVQAFRLETLTDVSQLRHVAGDLVISGNTRLPCDETADWARGIEVEGRISICGN